MTRTREPIATTGTTARAGITVNGRALPADVAARVRRVVVDNDVNLPGMFELTFLDSNGRTTAEAGISVGTPVSVVGRGPSGSAVSLIDGEVTAIEGLLDGVTVRTVVRGYTMAHRLQRARRSRSFLNVTDGDVVRQVVAEAGLEIGQVVSAGTTHAYLAQVNQTDWEFLTARARETGFVMGMSGGVFYFRPGTDSVTATGGGLQNMARRAVKEVIDNDGANVVVNFPDTLISFRPRLSAGNLTPDVEVRVWDPMARAALAQNASTPAGGTPSAQSMGAQFASGGMVDRITGGFEAAAESAAAFNIDGVQAGLDQAMGFVPDALGQATGGLLGSPVGFLGPPPSPTAHIVVDRPIADTTTMATTGPVVAGAVGSAFGSTFAECEGEAKGNALIQPHATVDIQGVQGIFAGQWEVSRARHIFDDSEFGYRVIFSAHGRQDRTMLGLTSNGSRSAARNPVLDGVVCGVVSDSADPLGRGRVKVTLPWLSPTFDTDWAPNIQFCSGQRSGAIFTPEIGDEVLLAFEFGDVRRPYLLGAMMNNLTGWNIAKSGPIFAGGLPGLATEAVDIASETAGAAIGSGIGFAVGGPVGAQVGALVGKQVGDQVGREITNEAAGAVMAPGMVSEVQHRGFVSSTGNALLFYDVPMIPPLPTAGVLPTEVSTAATGSLAGVGAVGSAVRLGSQGGELGITVDQVNGGVNVTASPVPGVTLSPVPNINITAADGFVNLSAGAGGTMLIDGGLNLIIKSGQSITLDAGLINIIGLPLVNGVPIPL